MKPKTKLKKKLGVFDLFAIASGAMISSGLFVLPGLAFYFAGPAMLIAYLIASLLMFPAVFSISELATAMPKSGGNYFFVQRSFGPLVGTIAGLLDWFSISLKSAFALLGIGGIFLYFFPDIGYNGVTYIAAATTLFFAFLNLFSVKGSGTFQIVLVFFLLVILAFFIITGFSSVNVEQFKPFNPKGWPAVFAVVGMVFVSFGGLTKVTAVAEETKDPTKNIPRAMFMAFFIISLVYLLTVFVTVGNVAPAELSGSLTPVALAAKNAIGPIGGLIITIAAALAFATTGNAGIMAASRSPLAMSKDGLIPKFFSKTSKKFGTPMSSIIFTSAFIIFTVLFLSLEVLVKTASTMMILMFALGNLSVIIMRTSQIEGYRPTFKAPFFPYMQIAAIIVYGFLIFEMGNIPLLITGGFILLALVWYVFYVQRQIDNESAFIHLVKRITSHHLNRSNIENELRAISLERDSVEFDRFDHLVKDALILDIEDQINARDLFKILGEKLGEDLDKDPETIFNLFLERELNSSTVMTPRLAVPHIIIDGEKQFEIALVRSKDGIVFSDLHPKVHTIFVLVGSPDERNFHLRALMNIAHIVQEEHFEQRWMEARNIEQLRDVVLLSSRKR